MVEAERRWFRARMAGLEGSTGEWANSRLAPGLLGQDVRVSVRWLPAGRLIGLCVGAVGGSAAVTVLTQDTSWAVPAAAAGGVAGAFAPWLAERSLERRQAATRARQAFAPPVLRETPATLLRPERGAAGFTGRGTELDALRRWCADRDGSPVRLLLGGGGVGKTRLALKFAAQLRAQGWTAAFAPAGVEATAVSAAREFASGRVLLVVDYAEARPGLAELLRAVAGDAQAGPQGQLRVLLLARGAGEWWDRLGEDPDAAVRALVAHARPHVLSPALAAAISDEEVVRAAVADFSRVLSVPAPEQVRVDIRAERPSVLVLHAAALVAVLDAAGRPRDERSAGVVAVAEAGVVEELLSHERAYWGHHGARQAGLEGRVARGISPPGSHRSRRDSLPSPGSSHQPVSTRGPRPSGRTGQALFPEAQPTTS
jgi:hypothetical protein